MCLFVCDCGDLLQGCMVGEGRVRVCVYLYVPLCLYGNYDVLWQYGPCTDRTDHPHAACLRCVLVQARL